jgi:hypothetical protein
LIIAGLIVTTTPGPLSRLDAVVPYSYGRLRFGIFVSNTTHHYQHEHRYRFLSTCESKISKTRPVPLTPFQKPPIPFQASITIIGSPIHCRYPLGNGFPGSRMVAQHERNDANATRQQLLSPTVIATSLPNQYQRL